VIRISRVNFHYNRLYETFKITRVSFLGLSVHASWQKTKYRISVQVPQQPFCDSAASLRVESTSYPPGFSSVQYQAYRQMRWSNRVAHRWCRLLSKA